MFASQLRRRCIALLAMLAVAFGALAPTLAQAVVAGGAAPEGAVMVCTASGMLWVQADGDVLSDEGSSTLADLKKPCTWCSMHAVAAPPAMQAALPLLTLPLFRVALNPRFTRPFYAVPRTSAARTASG